ncbi:hypothetical protein BJ508DRAFT_309147 [Ascobolus immersus RN42]|uniref:Uncharacterized protein n=1 Tax=Ascobolus immersus RN42 TaxID=1160509 RepID=A0A3N4I1D6_ASCIM|nr:hypothetical protein BJ508DRAFT_309147 [Ascobolus immersus RN42]
MEARGSKPLHSSIETTPPLFQLKRLHETAIERPSKLCDRFEGGQSGGPVTTQHAPHSHTRRDAAENPTEYATSRFSVHHNNRYTPRVEQAAKAPTIHEMPETRPGWYAASKIDPKEHHAALLESLHTLGPQAFQRSFEAASSAPDHTVGLISDSVIRKLQCATSLQMRAEEALRFRFSPLTESKSVQGLPNSYSSSRRLFQQCRWRPSSRKRNVWQRIKM